MRLLDILQAIPENIHARVNFFRVSGLCPRTGVVISRSGGSFRIRSSHALMHSGRCAFSSSSFSSSQDAPFCL